MDQRDVVREGYDEIVATYAAEREDEGRDRELVASLASRLADGSRVLDAGCGSGTPGSDALAATHDVVGLDISRGQLLAADERGPVTRLTQGDLAAIPFAASTFDAVVSFHAVIHVPREEHAAVFTEFERVLRPGGQLLAAVGAGAWAGENDDWLDTGERMAWSFHGADRNQELLEKAGFDVRAVEEVPTESGGRWAIVQARA